MPIFINILSYDVIVWFMKENDSLVEGAFKMDELVEYQQGSIVSRTLIDRDTGTVTLFAFDRGQSLSEHTAPFDAIIMVLDGTASITIANRPYDVGAGEAIVMPANIPHSVKAISRFKMLLTMIR